MCRKCADWTLLQTAGEWDIRGGDIVTAFGGTTYLQEASREGAEFSRLHARLHEEGTTLQYTCHGHLAESSNAKLWAVPESEEAAGSIVPGQHRQLANPALQQRVHHLSSD